MTAPPAAPGALAGVIDPDEALARLAGCEAPRVIGVRHHSPACAAAMPEVLEAFAPDRVLLELPVEFQPWIEWLARGDLQAPVALAGVREDGTDLAFYPFADFSPELAVVRWAGARGVAIEAFDLPAAARAEGGAVAELLERIGETPESPLLAALLARAGVDDAEALWDHMVETRAIGAGAEAVRRAALLVGWALRVDAAAGAGVPAGDRRREAFMRARVAEALARGERVACVVGSFHAAALVDGLREDGGDEDDGEAEARGALVTSLIPYSYELLDSRSGYPAGIRDPMWQQRVYETVVARGELEAVVARMIVEVCAGVRGDGHVAGVPDAAEAVRMAIDLARLRGLPAPGRREALEAIASCLGRGETLGRGRVLARSLDRVMVGRRRGQLGAGTPRSGLAPAVESLLEALRLPGPGTESEEAKTIRLDPIRSTLDRRRHVALQRLAACAVPYARLEAGVAAGGAETLTRVWTVRWQPQTEAMLELAGIRGVTLEQAAAGALRAEVARLEADDALTAARRLEAAEVAAECGLAALAAEHVRALAGPFLAEAGLVEILAAIELVERVRRGHVAGLPVEAGDAVPGEIEVFAVPVEVDAAPFLAAAVAALEGLEGSTSLDDARAMLELVRLFEHRGDTLGEGRLVWAIERMAAEGSPVMQGAAGVVLAALGRVGSEALGERMGSWIDAAGDRGGHRALAQRLRGALVVAAPLFEADPGFAAGMIERVGALEDDAFLARLPALREGFDVLSPAARERLLVVLGERIGGDDVSVTRGGLDVIVEEDPALLEVFARADAAGREAIAAELAELAELPGSDATIEPAAHGEGERARTSTGAIAEADRWRLILGRQRRKMSAGAARIARSLDELYGGGRGEGEGGDLFGAGPGGGKDEAFPNAREWGEELEALFGGEVYEEVLGKAVERGRAAALLEADPDRLTPSVELLEQILSLRGGLSEAHIARLRPLVQRIVDALVAELATRVTPALAGVAVPRPTSRPGGPLDLRRTIRANLATVRKRDDGAVQLVPERLVFASRGKKAMDWHIVLVVDVSGSMEPSVIYSAMMAAILAGVPWMSVSFLAFSTEVVDLSGRVDDPLGLLLEVQVGGGTHIARGLAVARQRIRVPRRSLVVCVSDFEEGWPVDGLLAEVRALVGSGVTALGIAALDDAGKPRYCKPIAELVAGAGMPVAALTPLELARWIGEKVRG